MPCDHCPAVQRIIHTGSWSLVHCFPHEVCVLHPGCLCWESFASCVVGWGGGWHKASVSDCLPLEAPIGLSPLVILTLRGPERVLVVSTKTRLGGGSEARKKVCVPETDLPFRAPSINFFFFPRKNFLMWVRGLVRRRSQAAIPLGNAKPWPGEGGRGLPNHRCCSPHPPEGATGQGGAYGERLQASRAPTGCPDGHTHMGGGFNRVHIPPHHPEG